MFRLLDLLQSLQSHPFLKGRFALKGGTALNLFLFDVCTLLRSSIFDWPRLRLGFVVYGGANRKDWQEISLDNVRVDPREVEQQLLPVLRADLAPVRSDIGAWSESLVKEGRKLLTGLLPLATDEMEFLRLLNGDGEIRPEFLTADEAMQSTIRAHPGLQWKVLNVRKSTGMSPHD
ncbi:MAG: hypothetical protein V1791_13685 [Pseudomonadota bacterium]